MEYINIEYFAEGDVEVRHFFGAVIIILGILVAVIQPTDVSDSVKTLLFILGLLLIVIGYFVMFSKELKEKYISKKNNGS